MTTGIELAGTIEDRNAPTAGRAEPPGPGPAIGAGRVSHLDLLLDILPIGIFAAAVSVVEKDMLGFYLHLDARDLPATDRPFPTAPPARCENTGTPQFPNVQWPRTFGCALRSIVPAAPASPPAHSFCSEILPK